MVGCTIRVKNMKSDWLMNLLEEEFFSSCRNHPELKKNEKNVFCIDCNDVFCKHCLSSDSHGDHRAIQICKYVYHDVIRLQDIQKHLDCSRIQTYKINGEKAVHLNPRPQLKDSSKNSKLKGGSLCEACGRHLQDSPSRYCSIACKVLNPLGVGNLSLGESSSSKEETRNNKNESSNSMTESSSGTQFIVSSALKPTRRLNKRKGIPRRAPCL